MTKGQDQTARDILSEITVFMKYAKYLPEEERRETWDELVDRNVNMHLEKFPHLADEIRAVYDEFVRTKKVLPSMRSMQFAGRAVELNNARLYNCSYLPVKDIEAFSETMFLLLSGTGVGYSVQRHHVDQLPPIKIPQKTRRFLIDDSITGWADAVLVLMRAYLDPTKTTRPVFDFRDIRKKGARLVTSGGKAPGPEPLRICLTKIEALLSEKEPGSKLTTLEAHDIQCHIADAVLSGGIRRAAMIALFSYGDNSMSSSKSGAWYELNPQRGRANNSAVLLRHRMDRKSFNEIWEYMKASGAGEPGFYFTNDKEIGTNPCAEISLKPYGFCNLTEINAANILDQDDYNARSKAAAFIGTLQAAYTDFYYLRDEWKETAEKEALLGVSMTGIASGTVTNLDMEMAAKIAVEENERVAELLGINKARRVTTVKPSGTTSLVLGSSSGVHAWHNDYYLRRIRVNKNEAIYAYLAIYHPELIEDEFFSPETTAVITVPQKAPAGAVTRHTETAVTLLERVKQLHDLWINPGHKSGDNTHNVSCTINIKDDEWDRVRDFLWVHRNSFTAVSCLPHSDHSYQQAPFEDCTKYTYDKLVKTLGMVDLTRVIEPDDNTSLADNLACYGGACLVE
jgi:ribonucleoside-triphosphate reductase